MIDKRLLQIPVLVVSCDKYADLWDPFFKIFRNKWPDCTFPIYLGTNYKQIDNPDVETIAIGEDLNWASNLHKMLDTINSAHVIMFLEDFLITENIDNNYILKLVEIAFREDVGCLRLAAGLPLAFPPSAPVEGYPGIGTINKDEQYRVSAQVAIWKVETLRKVLLDGMNAWEFEDIGTYISKRLNEQFWGLYAPAIVYSQCVEKGKWKPEGLEICREAGVEIQSEARDAFTPQEMEVYFHDVDKKAHSALEIQTGIKHFKTGHKSKGFRKIYALLKITPFNFRLWGTLFTGFLYPSLFDKFINSKFEKRISLLRNK